MSRAAWLMLGGNRERRDERREMEEIRNDMRDMRRELRDYNRPTRGTYPMRGYAGWPEYDEPYGYDEPEGRMRRYSNGRFAPRAGYDEDAHDGEARKIGFGEPERMGAAWTERERAPMRLNRFYAKKWVDGLESADGKRGGKWTYDEAKKLLMQHGIPEEKLCEYWAVMCALYSDYSAVLKRYNVSTPEIYVELARAFIDDPDAEDNKAARYFEHIVRK